MGIGMAVIIAGRDARRAKSILQARQIGRIERGSGKVRLKV
jgi:phosphoribosylaminoimidazole (AIR) synthetase